MNIEFEIIQSVTSHKEKWKKRNLEIVKKRTIYNSRKKNPKRKPKSQRSIYESILNLRNREHNIDLNLRRKNDKGALYQ